MLGQRRRRWPNIRPALAYISGGGGETHGMLSNLSNLTFILLTTIVNVEQYKNILTSIKYEFVLIAHAFVRIRQGRLIGTLSEL